jgi:endonuclease G, mitochondrial
VSSMTSNVEGVAESVAAAGEEQRELAAERVENRADEREAIVEDLQEGGVAAANSPERIAKRIDRLSQLGETPLPAPPLGEVARGEEVETAGAILEQIINTPDFIDIRYLEGGVAAARAVCRIDVRDGLGRVVGFGTGSLVSPRLLLTNHHVLQEASVAATSAAEFNFQDGLDGLPLQPQLFQLDPGAFFLADKERDFALVAVAASEQELAQFGFNPLIEAEGKAVIGEFVTIIQHPRGQKKQVSLRENRIVDVLETFLHYQTDTEPGSSGSPVFNDQWEVVALHHAGVPAPDHPELGGIMNEGIRVSRILKFIHAQSFAPGAAAFVNQVFRPERLVLPDQTGTNGSGRAAAVQQQMARPAEAAPAAAAPATSTPAAGTETSEVSGDAIRLTVPIEITIRAGGREAVPASAPEVSSDGAAAVEEAIRIDPDYGDRRGYDADFLGSGADSVALPTLPEELLAKAATNSRASAEPRHVFPYHHYSVVMNKERRLAFFTAVNIDGNLSLRLKREPDRWFLDPRLPGTDQTGEEVYRDNDLDRGHLVRRLDPAWGRSKDLAKIANDDTFHFTNCTPQHKNFNQNKTTWAGLEDYILENADNRDLKVSVFTGPVLAPDDDVYRGVMLPRQFWKVVVMAKQSGGLSATGYLLSQEQLLAGLEVAPAEFSYGAYRTFQVPIRRIEGLTGLSFGALADADPLAQLEELTTAAREVESSEDLVL